MMGCHRCFFVRAVSNVCASAGYSLQRRFDQMKRIAVDSKDADDGPCLPPLTDTIRLKIAFQIAEGLNDLHTQRQSIVHRYGIRCVSLCYTRDLPVLTSPLMYPFLLFDGAVI